jgi:hypothetical protein
MIAHLKMPLFALVALAALLPGEVYAQVPSAIAVPGQNIVTTLHAEGAQVYECKAGPDKKLVWQAREPIATLLLDGKTAGRHYAGPMWELADGSSVTAKAVANAPGATLNDILWLKLDVTSQRGDGGLYGVTSVHLPKRTVLRGLCVPGQRFMRPMRDPAIVLGHSAATSGSAAERKATDKT